MQESPRISPAQPKSKSRRKRLENIRQQRLEEITADIGSSFDSYAVKTLYHDKTSISNSKNQDLPQNGTLFKQSIDYRFLTLDKDALYTGFNDKSVNQIHISQNQPYSIISKMSKMKHERGQWAAQSQF